MVIPNTDKMERSLFFTSAFQAISNPSDIAAVHFKAHKVNRLLNHTICYARNSGTISAQQYFFSTKSPSGFYYQQGTGHHSTDKTGLLGVYHHAQRLVKGFAVLYLQHRTQTYFLPVEVLQQFIRILANANKFVRIAGF